MKKLYTDPRVLLNQQRKENENNIFSETENINKNNLKVSNSKQ